MIGVTMASICCVDCTGRASKAGHSARSGKGMMFMGMYDERRKMREKREGEAVSSFFFYLISFL
jgi:hypothetical protein